MFIALFPKACFFPLEIEKQLIIAFCQKLRTWCKITRRFPIFLETSSAFFPSCLQTGDEDTYHHLRFVSSRLNSEIQSSLRGISNLFFQPQACLKSSLWREFVSACTRVAFSLTFCPLRKGQPYTGGIMRLNYQSKWCDFPRQASALTYLTFNIKPSVQF